VALDRDAPDRVSILKPGGADQNNKSADKKTNCAVPSLTVRATLEHPNASDSVGSFKPGQKKLGARISRVAFVA
jgi:hypothetical protein